MRGFFAFAILCAFIGSAQAHSRRNDMLAPGLIHMLKSMHHHHARHHPHYRHSDMPQRHYAMHYRRYSDGRPSAWCGWYLRQIMGVADRSYNIAANWAHFGSATSPHIGAIVVWPHHVGKIVGYDEQRHQWMVLSGNDGHAVRTRPRSLAGAIAFRDAG